MDGLRIHDSDVVSKNDVDNHCEEFYKEARYRISAAFHHVEKNIGD
jgi:hypothetical protein